MTDLHYTSESLPAARRTGDLVTVARADLDTVLNTNTGQLMTTAGLDAVVAACARLRNALTPATGGQRG
jgi:hypothetical protein